MEERGQGGQTWPRNAAWEAEGLGVGFPWKEDNSSKLQEREHLALRNGRWGKKWGGGERSGVEGKEELPPPRRFCACQCMSVLRLVSCISLKSPPPLPPTPALPCSNPDPESRM